MKSTANWLDSDTILPRQGDINFRLLTNKNPESLAVLRHSCAHVMARAVMRLFDGVGLAFGPTTGNGYYYDFDLERPITEEDFPAIEKEMAAIIRDDEAFERIEEPRERAVEICRDLHQPLKVEHIEEGLADEGVLSFYRQGEFIDLCRGPHVPSPKADRCVQTAQRGRCLLEGRRLATTTPTPLRHCLVQQEGPGRLSPTPRRGQAPRSSCAGQKPRPVHDRSDGRFGVDSLAAARRDDSH